DLTEAEKTCLIAAKKRELWIRMLSGGELGQLPDAWAYIRPDLDPDEAPLDYIIAEHIVSDVAPTLPLDLDGDGDTDDLYPIDPDVDGVFQDPYNVPYGETFENPIKLSFFSYGRMGTGIDIDLSAYWNADVNFRYPTSAEFPIGHPMQPRLPEMVRIHLPFMYASTYVGAPDFTRILEQMIDVPSAYTRADLVEAAS
ncbi:MAG: hypothetical protein JXR94_22365, partial [Candidatus Hydrogenedentes bacterium]|nr:hypothetical protein [Candidatus Hydrogenedentota bacterium]